TQPELRHRNNEKIFFFSSRRRHTRFSRDWSSDVCSSDLGLARTVDSLEGNETPATLRPCAQHRSRAGPRPISFAGNCGISAWTRSEERRVGKESKSRCSQKHDRQKWKQQVLTGEFSTNLM